MALGDEEVLNVETVLVLSDVCEKAFIIFHFHLGCARHSSGQKKKAVK